MAKRDLEAGETLDEYGMFMTYGEAVERRRDEREAATCRRASSRAVALRRDVAKDEVLTYDDVELPPGRLADELRAEQYRHFRGETWLEERLSAHRVDGRAERLDTRRRGRAK